MRCPIFTCAYCRKGLLREIEFVCQLQFSGAVPFLTTPAVDLSGIRPSEDPRYMSSSESSEVAMTEELLIQQCKKHQGYRTPVLNKNIYVNHLGLTNISCLDAFHGCRVLYLNNNAIDDLVGLQPLQQLHALYVGSNAIRSCKSFPSLPSLRLLDITSNYIEDFEGFSSIPNLETLLASRNCVKSLQGLESNKELVTVDLSKNFIECDEDVLPWVLGMENLRSCMFYGNRFVNSMPNYRKTMIALIPSLRFVDQYPVFPDERSCAEAYAEGGVKAEEVQRRENQRREEEQRRRQFEFFCDERQRARECQAVNGPTRANTTYFNDNDMHDIYVPNTVGRA